MKYSSSSKPHTVPYEPLYEPYTHPAQSSTERSKVARHREWWRTLIRALLGAMFLLVLGFLLGYSHLARASSAGTLASAAGAVNGEIDYSESPHFIVRTEGAVVGSFPLKSTHVHAYVSGMLADVVVTQTYRNTGSVPLEAQYVFPGSARAAVYAMRMTVGNRQIDAEIKEKKEAQQVYEQAKKEGKTASLLEQERSNIFQMRVANILPGDVVTVQMHYTELLKPENGEYTFVYPTVVGPRYSSPSKQDKSTDGLLDALASMAYVNNDSDTAASAFDLEMEIDSPIAIKSIASDTHKIQVNHDQGSSYATLDIVSDGKRSDNRDVIVKYRLAGDAVESGVMLYQGSGTLDGATGANGDKAGAGESENFFLAMLEPPQRVQTSAINPREYIFVVDVSGSMHGFPLDTSKQMLRELIGQLRPSDQFNVLLFASSNRFLSTEPVPATQANIEQAIAMIDNTNSQGGTELMPALRKVYDLPKNNDVSRTVVVVTDGYVSVEREAFQIIRKNLSKANVFAFGIGSSVNRELIEGIARAGMGEPFVITDPQQARVQAAKFRKMIDSPVLTDVSVRFEGMEVYDVEPQALPDLLAQRPVVVFGKWRGAPEGVAIISGQTAQGAYSHAVPVQRHVSTHAKALRYLWARHRIASLTDAESLTHEPRFKKAITQLGLDYNLLTRYTSFVAVDKVVRNPTGENAKVNQPVPLPKGVTLPMDSQEPMMAAHVPSTPEPETWGAVMVMLSMLAMAARRRQKAQRGKLTV